MRGRHRRRSRSDDGARGAEHGDRRGE